MNVWILFRRFFGVVAFGILLGVCYFFFGLFLATKSHPVTEGTEEVTYLQDSLIIARNLYNVPHIIAKNEHDVFFGIGYAHAQDRLWQMDIARRAGRGRLSEVMGSKTLEADLFLRSLGIATTAEKLVKSCSKESLAALQAYSDGVNAYREATLSKLPFEFDALEYRPEKWTPSDCFVVARMMALEMNLAFSGDIALAEIAAKLGETHARELIPGWPAEAPCVTDFASESAPNIDSLIKSAPLPQSLSIQTEHSIDQKKQGFTKNTSSSAIVSSPEIHELFTRLRSVTDSVRSIMGWKGSAVGSNSWAIKSNRSISYGDKKANAVLCNDPHLTLMAPPRWYQAHLSSPEFNVVGMTIPGLPFIVSGRNDDITWGITNMMIDDCDFFIEKIDSSNKKRYISADGKARKFRIDRDTIFVKDTLPVIHDYRFTQRSCVISDYLPGKRMFFELDKTGERGKYRTQYLEKYLLTFSWTGNLISDEPLAFYRLNKAKNWTQFQRAVSGIAVPGLNMTYADKLGNIGIAPSGSIPIRMFGTSPYFPNSSWVTSGWQQVLPASALPRSYNPQRGYVFSANNKTSRSFPNYISYLWEPPSRAQRIGELLNLRAEYNSIEGGIMQIDVISPYAKQLMNLTISDLKMRSSSLSERGRACVQLLSNWDGSMEQNEVQPAVYSAFLERLLYNTFADELGDNLYKQYTFFASLPLRKLPELLTANDSTAQYWFDIKSTSTRENKTWIIVKSFNEAISQLETMYNDTNIYAWQWGKIHTLEVPHILGSAVPALRTVANFSPVSLGGDVTTINNSQWKITEPFKVVLGASMRIVCDMQDSVVYTIVPGGSSGQPLSAQYTNQMQLWLNGGFVKIPIQKTAHSSFSEKLTLLPQKK